MPTYVPDRPATTRTSDHVVGRAVSQRHGRAWQDSLSFLLGYCVPPVVDSTLYAATGSPREIYFAYKRSPGARALVVLAELHDTTNAGQECSVLVELEAGGTAYLGPSGPFRSGSSPLMTQAGTWTDRAQHLDAIDVTALTVGTVYWFRVTWTNTPGTTRGICRLKAFEVPRSSLAEDSTDAGIDGGWPFAGNGLYAGPTALSGFAQYAAEILRARDELRRHMQCVTLASLGTPLNPQSWILPVSAAFTPSLFNRVVQPGFWFRVRRKYETTTTHRHGFLCRYSTNSATYGAEIRVTATSRTTGTVAQTTVVLPPSIAFVASPYATIDVPCDGADQDVRVTFEHLTQDSVDLHLSQFVLFEDDALLAPAAGGLLAEDGADLLAEDGSALAEE